MRLIFALVFALLFASPSHAVNLVGGTSGWKTNCNLNDFTYLSRVYYGTDQRVLADKCMERANAEMNLYPTVYKGAQFFFARCTGSQCFYGFLREGNVICDGTAAGCSYYKIDTVLTSIPMYASCSSPLFDDVSRTCIGGTATCPAGETKSLAVADCKAEDTYKVVGGEHDGEVDCKPGKGLVEEFPIPPLLRVDICEYALAQPIVVNNCWQSSVNRNMYCSFDYTSSGLVASSTTEPPITGPAGDPSQACPATGCPPVGGVGNGSDGTTGGTGTRPCGGSGEPACANGVPSGTTACGGVNQPACLPGGDDEEPGGGEGDGGGAAVCGGPGLPACEVNDPGAKPVCGGPGLPACQTEDNNVKNKLENILSYLTQPGTQIDPVAATGSDVAAAGLDGGTTFAGLKSWTLPHHASACPVGTFQVFGKAITMDAHCDFATNNLGALRSIMIAVYSLSALFIILKA